MLQPVTTLIPPAPEELLKSIFCNCRKGCGSNCGCRKIGIECSAVCGSCRGQSCLNTTSDDAINVFDFEDEPDLIDILSAEITVDEVEVDDEARIEEIDDAEEEEQEEVNENDE